MGKIGIFFYKIIFIIYFLLDLFLVKYIVWTSNLYKTLFYIRFILLIIYGIYSIIFLYIFVENLNFNLLIHHNKCYIYGYWLFSKARVIIGLLFVFSRFINNFNENNFEKYIINCPFTFNSNITNFNESIYGKRRCELYNINKNSRYKYQYICSYNASEDFKSDKTKDGFNKIVCVSKTHNIERNDIINEFNSVYENKDKNESNLFYCSRIDEPKKDEYIKDEYCNKEKNFYYSIIKWLLFFLYDLINLFHTELNSILSVDIYNRIDNIANEIRQQINMQFGDDDTEYDESNSNNVSFNEDEDKNIIVEGHNVYDVDINIKDYMENNGKQKIE